MTCVFVLFVPRKMNSLFTVLCLQVFSSYYMQSLVLQNVYSYPERLQGEEEE